MRSLRSFPEPQPSACQRTAKSHASLLDQEQASPPSEASGNRDFTTLKIKASFKPEIPLSIHDTVSRKYIVMMRLRISALWISSNRHQVLPNAPGVRLSTVANGPHLQGGDHPGQEQGSVSRTLHCVLTRAWKTKGKNIKKY